MESSRPKTQGTSSLWLKKKEIPPAIQITQYVFTLQTTDLPGSPVNVWTLRSDSERASFTQHVSSHADVCKHVRRVVLTATSWNIWSVSQNNGLPRGKWNVLFVTLYLIKSSPTVQVVSHSELRFQCRQDLSQCVKQQNTNHDPCGSVDLMVPTWNNIPHGREESAVPQLKRELCSMSCRSCEQNHMHTGRSRAWRRKIVEIMHWRIRQASRTGAHLHWQIQHPRRLARSATWPRRSHFDNVSSTAPDNQATCTSATNRGLRNSRTRGLKIKLRKQNCINDRK